jgi:hypothetical protein
MVMVGLFFDTGMVLRRGEFIKVAQQGNKFRVTVLSH